LSVPQTLEDDPALIVETLKQAFAVWENVECSYFSAKFGGVTTEMGTRDFFGFSGVEDGVSLFTFMEQNWPADWVKGISLAVPVYDGPTGDVSETDVVFNADPKRGYKWNTAYVCPSDKMDLLNVAVHEIGHLIGLNHSLDLYDAMYYKILTGETSKRRLTADDIQGVCAIYPIAGKDGSPCLSDADCPSGACVVHSASGGLICARACVCDTDCPPYLSCDDGRCLPNLYGEGKMGTPCAKQADCRKGLECAVPNETSAGYCSRPCDAANLCPEGWNCAAPFGKNHTVCVSAAAAVEEIEEEIEVKAIKASPEKPVQGAQASLEPSIKAAQSADVETAVYVRHLGGWALIKDFTSDGPAAFTPDAPGVWVVRVIARKAGGSVCGETAKDFGLTVASDGSPLPRYVAPKVTPDGEGNGESCASTTARPFELFTAFIIAALYKIRRRARRESRVISGRSA